MGMRLPLWCLGLKFLRNFNFATWFYKRPIRDIGLGNVNPIFSLNSESGQIVSTWLPEDEEDCVTASRIWSNKFRLMNDFKPSATNVNVAEREVQSLLDTGVCVLTSIWIGSFEKVLSCGFALSRNQNACGPLLTTCYAFDWLRILHELAESTWSVVEMFLILIGTCRGSIFATSFWLRAAILSSPPL